MSKDAVSEVRGYFSIQIGPISDDGVQSLWLVLDGERRKITQGDFSLAISHLGDYVPVQTVNS